MQTRYKILLCALTTLITACQQQSPTSESVVYGTEVAKVNNQAITSETLDVFLIQRGVNIEDLQDVQKEQLVNQLISFELLAQEALAESLEQDPLTAAEIYLRRTEILAAAEIENYFASQPITEEMLQAEYQTRIQEMNNNEYKARHILVAEESEAEEIIESLNNGGDFAELAKTHSTEPGADERGGDLGWFTANQMVAPFSSAVQSMEPGQFSETPVKTRFGWHVILLEETRETPAPTFEELREQLEFSIKNGKIESYINELREKASVTIL
ncbi:MAG: peptidylprolyl isomerase [Gammaproteobacteria bacterium]|nr:peptidylprolyl isomerase [Gammaproteobacteria bacterium]